MSNYIDPEREIFGEFQGLAQTGKIHMLNLIELNPTARYDDGTMVTGSEAYSAYGRESMPIFHQAGGKIVWSGEFELMLIGPTGKKWDICFIAEYPDAASFISMVKNPDYQNAVRHRQAAVKDSRLIRLSPSETGDSFG